MHDKIGKVVSVANGVYDPQIRNQCLQIYHIKHSKPIQSRHDGS